MRPTIKATLLFACVLLCAAGAILSPKVPAKDERDSRSQVVPVNNHQPHRGIWLRV
jgi:hypothetical protein